MGNKTTHKDCDQSETLRDAKGRFLPGSKLGNGRPQGAVCKLISMTRTALMEVLPDIIERAKAGDEDAIQTLFRYGFPKAKLEALPMVLPSTPEEIIKAMSAGALDVDTANAALAAHLSAGKIRELEELEAKVAEMAARLETLGGRI